MVGQQRDEAHLAGNDIGGHHGPHRPVHRDGDKAPGNTGPWQHPSYHRWQHTSLEIGPVEVVPLGQGGDEAEVPVGSKVGDTATNQVP